jgi:YtxH-like protein
MKNLIKSILKTAVYFVDQTDRMADNVRDRVADTADRISDIRDRAVDIYEGPSYTMRSLLMFAAGVGVGVGAAILLAPASGEEIRSQIGQKVQDMGDRVKNRFSSATGRPTGTEGI